MKKLILTMLVTGLFAFLIIESTCTKPSDEEESPLPVYNNGEGEVGPEGGIVSISDQNSPIYGASVKIPEGALSTKTTIKIVPTPSEIKFPLDTNLQLVSFEPAGLKFNTWVEITVPYNGINIEKALLYNYNPDEHLVSEKPWAGSDPLNKTVTGLAGHFSYFMACECLFDCRLIMCAEELPDDDPSLFNYAVKAIYDRNEPAWVYSNTQDHLLDHQIVINLNDLEERPFESENLMLNSPNLAEISIIPYTNFDSVINGDYCLEVCKLGYATYECSEIIINSTENWSAPEIEERYLGRLELGPNTVEVRRFEEDDHGDWFAIGEEDIDVNEPNGWLYAEGWFNGLPCVFNFDGFEISDDNEYWLKIRWNMSLVSEGVPSITLIYETQNYNDRRKPSQMYYLNPEVVYNNTILIPYVDVEYGQPCPGTPTVEYVGKVYHTVQIGDQCWLKENLNVGTMIDNHFDMENNEVIEKYCYDNNPANCEEYGGLYQWEEMMQYSVSEGAQGICPPGWHIPTDEEWKILEGFVDSQYNIGDPEWDKEEWRGYDAGKQLKAASKWAGSGNGSDQYGFSALPAGVRSYYLGKFKAIDTVALFWTSNRYENLSNSWARRFSYDNSWASRTDQFRDYGYSVRCLRD